METRDLCVFEVARLLIEEFGVKATFVAGYRMDMHASSRDSVECQFWGDVIRAIEVCSSDTLISRSVFLH
jgi:hypothetical protein